MLDGKGVVVVEEGDEVGLGKPLGPERRDVARVLALALKEDGFFLGVADGEDGSCPLAADVS